MFNTTSFFPTIPGETMLHLPLVSTKSSSDPSVAARMHWSLLPNLMPEAFCKSAGSPYATYDPITYCRGQKRSRCLSRVNYWPFIFRTTFCDHMRSPSVNDVGFEVANNYYNAIYIYIFIYLFIIWMLHRPWIRSNCLEFDGIFNSACSSTGSRQGWKEHISNVYPLVNKHHYWKSWKITILNHFQR